MKTWLITGVSRGLGLALAKAALARGDMVIGTVREGRPNIEDHHSGRLHILSVEMGDGKAVEASVKQAFEIGKRIDVIVNNAGFGLLGAIEEVSDEDMARVFEVNVFGPLKVIRSALPYLRAQRAGHIINVTSIAGRAPNAGSGIYASTKYALEGLSAALAIEVAPIGIHVTAVAPGAFRTDFLSSHSIRKSTKSDTNDYAATAAKSVATLSTMDGKQAGDPDRAAEALLKLVDSENPPTHLLLGSDALRRAREKLDVVIEEINEWETVTRSTDFPS
jgi:NAD(P)-dependent dehydrogenase (short-subunit alcohol dehydrogenase family)